jgi:hypothetical protein
MGALSQGDIAHIHPSDNSMYIPVGLPVTYVMVYAPRNRLDLAVVAELLEAAILHATQQTR